MVEKSLFKFSSKNLVKEEDFEHSLVEVVIIKMNKRTSTKFRIELQYNSIDFELNDFRVKLLFKQSFATNLLCFKDCLEVLWDKKNAFSPSFDLARCWWTPTYSIWTATSISFNFSVSVIVAQFTIFSSFSGLELLEPF